METLMKADIFFFISTIATIVLTILLVVCFYYLARTLKNFRDISDTLKKHVDRASGHIDELSKKVEESAIFSFIFGKKRTSRKRKNED